MLLPHDFKTSIAKTFYDKDIAILGDVVVTEADGAKRTKHGVQEGSFKGNTRLANFKKVQKDYGLDYQIDIIVTCDTDVAISTDKSIEYAGIKYNVTDVLPFDSHLMIVGVAWSRQ